MYLYKKFSFRKQGKKLGELAHLFLVDAQVHAAAFLLGEDEVTFGQDLDVVRYAGLRQAGKFLHFGRGHAALAGNFEQDRQAVLVRHGIGSLFNEFVFHSAKVGNWCTGNGTLIYYDGYDGL